MQTENIASAIATYLPGAQVQAINRLTGGVSADVFRVDINQPGGGKKAIVLRAMGQSGLDSELEYSLLSSLYQAGRPVPEPLHLDISKTYLDKPYLLMSFVEGTSKLPDHNTEQHIATMARALADVHNTPASSLPELPLRLDPVTDLVSFLPIGTEWTALRDCCTSLKPAPFTGKSVLLHGDFWFQNLIWQGDRIVAILDWEDAAFGDPVSDLACALLELRYVYDDALVDHFLDAYVHQYDVDLSRLALWQVYVAAAAQHFMAQWGLDPSREAHIRRTALRQIRMAAPKLLS